MREMPEGLTLGAQNTLQQHILNWGHYYQMKSFVDSESPIRIFFFSAKSIWTARQDFNSFISPTNLFVFVGLCWWFTCTFVAARQRRQAEQAENHLNKMKHAKNVAWTVEKQSRGQRRFSTCCFSPVLPQSSQSVKPGGRQGRHAFILDQHAMMLFFPAPPLVFIIIPGPLWGSSKTIFIDSGEAYLCLMHCLYIGPQSHPSGNKQ